MIKIFATDLVVSAGYQDADSIRFNEDGTACSFRCGFSKYDKNAENKRRWENIQCKAFGDIAKRIKAMKLVEKSHINISGSFDFDTWEKDGKTNKAPVLLIEEIEYSSSRPASKDESNAKPEPKEKPASGKNDGYEAVDDDDLPFEL